MNREISAGEFALCSSIVCFLLQDESFPSTKEEELLCLLRKLLKWKHENCYLSFARILPLPLHFFYCFAFFFSFFFNSQNWFRSRALVSPYRGARSTSEVFGFLVRGGYQRAAQSERVRVEFSWSRRAPTERVTVHSSRFLCRDERTIISQPAMVARSSMFGCYGSYSYRLWSLANVWSNCQCKLHFFLFRFVLLCFLFLFSLLFLVLCCLLGLFFSSHVDACVLSCMCASVMLLMINGMDGCKAFWWIQQRCQMFLFSNFLSSVLFSPHRVGRHNVHVCVLERFNSRIGWRKSFA